ncbi:MAG TPA: NAD(P)/FAD-dependent oxidoreductase [Gammaproteobacteria bacterium]|nr:NAD(P)/FAD-dependent oxidoreductase [Gammaproteobacteria bacterium]
MKDRKAVHRSESVDDRSDCVVVGASFAGLACAKSLAVSGLRVTVLERKSDPGEKLHTTGIIVKDAIDQIALLDGLPAELVRRVDGVRLYSPSMQWVDLAAPGYYFLATDTANVMRWLARQAEKAGARIAYGTTFRDAKRARGGFDLGELGAARFLVGADGSRSRVAATLGLGRSRKFLFGVEHEYAGTEVVEPGKLHCFIDRRIAPGYIGWVIAGVHEAQVGLARRLRGKPVHPNAAMRAFLDKVAPVFDFRDLEPSCIRAGLIPCGGVVRPAAARRALLVGDAAGMVSPVTAGGIHTALKHGSAAGHAIAGYLSGKCEDPSGWFVDGYPSFRAKRLLRFLFDHCQSDTAFDLLLGTRAMRMAASLVYFHHRGAFEPPARRGIRRLPREIPEEGSDPRV